jgi:hypothetical protein
MREVRYYLRKRNRQILKQGTGSKIKRSAA